MKDSILCTKFAPAQRASSEIVKRQQGLFKKDPLFVQLYDSVTEVVFILNKERQIVFFNKNFLNIIKTRVPDSIYGKRPGEALGCVYSNKTKGGCGTTEFCSACGAANAILKSQEGKQETKECRIIMKKRGDALDLLVKATPIGIGREKFTMFTATDISNEKRRKVLERIFFHDFLNEIFCLKLASEMIERKDKSPEVSLFSNGVNELIEMINSQRVLVNAENNELVVNYNKVSAREIIRELVNFYKVLAASKKVEVKIDIKDQKQKKENDIFITDKNILLRVLGNMLKNAIEASANGGLVKVSYKIVNKRIIFSFHNQEVIPRHIQLQIFQRSFSTKGEGRGIGTYSMKLLSEDYLKGKISFTSASGKGTTFKASYPISIK